MFAIQVAEKSMCSTSCNRAARVSISEVAAVIASLVLPFCCKTLYVRHKTFERIIEMRRVVKLRLRRRRRTTSTTQCGEA